MMLSAVVSYAQQCTPKYDHTGDCGNDLGCADNYGCSAGDGDGGLLQLMLGTGPYKYGTNQSYGFGLTEDSRESGASGLFGLGGDATTGTGHGTQGGYTTQGGYATQGGYESQPGQLRATTGYGIQEAGGYGAQAGFSGAVAVATATAVPDMIGDSTFGGGGFWIYAGDSYYPDNDVLFYCPQSSAQLSRLNMAENFNAKVQNRFFTDWRHFSDTGTMDVSTVYWDAGSGTYQNVAQTKTLNTDRVTFGFERLIGKKSSVEFRVPVIYSLGSKQSYNTFNNDLLNKTEWGNISLVFKREMHETQNFTFTGGLGLNMPTARDYECMIDLNNNNTASVNIDNTTWRLTPYFGFQWHPNRRTFGHFVSQLELPLSQSDVTFTDVFGNTGAVKFYDQTLLRLNASVGHWFYRNEHSGFLTGVAGMFEVHYTQALDSACTRSVYTNCTYIGPDPSNNTTTKSHPNVVNMVAAVPVEFGKTMVMNGFTFPVSGQQHFEWEYNLSVNRRF